MYYESGRKKNFYLWIILLIIAAVILNNPAVKKARPVRVLKKIAINVIYPFKYIANGLYSGVTGGTAKFFMLRGVQAENERLNADIKSYKAQIMLLSQIGADNKRLREMMGFRPLYFASRLIPVEIIARPDTNWFGIIEINKGRNDRIVADTAVVNDEGLVGRVLEVSDYSSKVLLITDPSSAVSVFDSETSDMGIANGNVMGPLKIRYMSANAEVKVGDPIITSGMSDTFPKGIIVGRVKYINKKDYDIFQKVDVSPAVNFSKLNKLFVVAK